MFEMASLMLCSLLIVITGGMTDPLLIFGKHESLPFEPDDVITELETDVGDTGLSVC